MRHRVKKVHLNRDYDHRRALQRSLVRSFVMYGFIKTTKPKALFARPKIEHLVEWGKLGDLDSRRRLLAEIPNKSIVSKFIEDAKIFDGRKGGYTRIINLGKRLGDKADMVRMEWSVQKKKEVKVEPSKEVKKETKNK